MSTLHTLFKLDVEQWVDNNNNLKASLFLGFVNKAFGIWTDFTQKWIAICEKWQIQGPPSPNSESLDEKHFIYFTCIWPYTKWDINSTLQNKHFLKLQDAQNI